MLTTEFNYTARTGELVLATMIVPTTKVFEAINLTQDYSRLLIAPDVEVNVTKVIEADTVIWKKDKT